MFQCNVQELVQTIVHLKTYFYHELFDWHIIPIPHCVATNMQSEGQFIFKGPTQCYILKHVCHQQLLIVIPMGDYQDRFPQPNWANKFPKFSLGGKEDHQVCPKLFKVFSVFKNTKLCAGPWSKHVLVIHKTNLSADIDHELIEKKIPANCGQNSCGNLGLSYFQTTSSWYSKVSIRM